MGVGMGFCVGGWVGGCVSVGLGKHRSAISSTTGNRYFVLRPPANMVMGGRDLNPKGTFMKCCLV